MGKTKIDYSLYLVTGREFLPPGKVCLPTPRVREVVTTLISGRTTMRALKK
jgi:hypothetical protein